MISSEFKSTIANDNLLRAKIMLKDSFVIDPTFVQFNEMFAYAKHERPDIMVPFDGEILENDPLKWDQEMMNIELVQLVNNFSDERVKHLKKVVSKVLADKIEKIRTGRESRERYEFTHSASATHVVGGISGNNSSKLNKRKEIFRKNALGKMVAGGRKICRLICEAEQNENRWSPDAVMEMEKAAKQILNAARSYNDNR